MTIANIEAKDVKIEKFYNNVDIPAVVNAVNNHLLKLKDDVLDEQKKQDIVDAIKSGKVEELQLKLGMKKGHKKIKFRADNMFGEKTLDNLKAGKVDENAPGTANKNEKNANKEQTGSQIDISPNVELPLTKDQYLALLNNPSLLVTKNANGELTEGCVLYSLRKLVITISKGGRAAKKDTLTFDFSNTDFINDQNAEFAFRAVKSVIDTYKPTNASPTYVYNGTVWNKGALSTSSTPEELPPTTFTGYEDIEEYLDSEINGLVSEDAKASLSPEKIEKVVDGVEYIYGDLHLLKAGKNRIITPTENCTNLRKKARKSLEAKLAFPTENVSLEDCFKLMAYMNLVATTFKDKITGTDELADIETDNFSWNTFADNNPFYVRNGILYFNDKGSMDDFDLLKKANLDEMAPGLALQDLAKFFTSRVAYKFEDQAS